MTFNSNLLIIFLTLLSLSHAILSDAADADALLKFKNSLQNADALANWNPAVPPCAPEKEPWKGVICLNGTVFGLQLENMNLTGTIDVAALTELKDLRTVSFMNNNFEGPFPEIKILGALRAVFFSGNKFSGNLADDAFSDMLSLRKLHLARNKFTGNIPSSIVKMQELVDLRLEENQFEGKIPEFASNKYEQFNVSNNALEGPIPENLSKMDKSAFEGNKGMCGKPLEECKTPEKTENDDPKSDENSPPTHERVTEPLRRKNPPVISIVIVAIVVLVALVAIGAVVIIVRRRNQAPSESVEAPSSSVKSKSVSGELHGPENDGSMHSAGGRKSEIPKLSFVREDRDRFDLGDLLKASAEILGSGCFGSSYKAALSSGSMMVVKRFKQMNNVAKDEFQEHMRRLGRLNHANLLAFVAYYYRKEEKLLVTDFVERGSLTLLLHGNVEPSLDWTTRLNIVKGVARGLAYLYKELPSLITPHGHLKSSNVLINLDYEPVLSDYGLVPVINQESAQELMVAYKSPEYLQLGRITKKTDVWSFGILILEILTGQLPACFLQRGKGNDDELASWVNSVRANQTVSVFDKEMEVPKNSEGEMLKLLSVALSCCEADVEKRLDIREVVEKVENVKETDGDDA